MKRTDDIDDPRRLVLIRALTAGLLGLGLTSAQAITFGTKRAETSCSAGLHLADLALPYR